MHINEPIPVSVLSSSRSTSQKYVEWLPGVAIALLLAGFLFNRVVSNSGMLLLGIYTMIRIKESTWIFHEKLMISLLGIAVLPLASDIFYEKWYFFQERGIMKMVLILLPVALFCWKPNREKQRLVHYMVLMTMLISTVYSLFHYWMDFSTMAATYKVSKVMPTLSNSDHIRIGWATVISIILAMYELISTRNTINKLVLSLYILLQIIFLHLLGAKTGLITLYFTFVILFFYGLPRGKKWLVALLIPMVISLPIIAYKTIPSLKERFHFIKYDFEHYSRGEYKPGLSDAVRFYSLKAGKDIIREHPWAGVGFSRLQSETEFWYKKNLPELGKENYFLPSSEYVIYWASGGILGLLIFVFHMIMPYFNRKLSLNPWFMAFFIPASISFIFETHLEGQLPLYTYAFFLAWFWYLSYSHLTRNT
jgi:O-antigen ligase